MEYVQQKLSRKRGVTLVGTAHGTSLDSLMKNPELVPLIGGLQSVILSGKEAFRDKDTRNSSSTGDSSLKKVRLERSGAPTFNIIVEIIDKYRWNIYPDVAKVVDAKLSQEKYLVETRWVKQLTRASDDNNHLNSSHEKNSTFICL